MNGGGPGSGIWKSTDGGDTWTRLKGGGWPDGPLGRIGVDVYREAARTFSTRSSKVRRQPAAAVAGAAPAAGSRDEAPHRRRRGGRSTCATA